MKKKLFSLLLILILTVSVTCGCGEKKKELPVSAKDPIEIHLAYGSGMDRNNAEVLIELIKKYNANEGREKGIKVNITSGFESDETNGADDLQKVIAGAKDAPELPDLIVTSTQTAVTLHRKGLLQAFDYYFTDEELDKYYDWYINEGRFEDGGLYCFPFAKSTECLFVNRTLFDPFAEENGYTLDDLDSMESIYIIGKKYQMWTNAKTHSVANDGKAFFTSDSWFNVLMAGVWQFDDEWFASDNTLNEDTASACYIRKFLIDAIARGVFLSNGGYSSGYLNSGDVVCCVGSTAGVFYYNDQFTDENGNEVPLDLAILPYPHFKNGDHTAISRGEGLSMTKSDTRHEYAAAEVVKWLTATQQNMEYVAKTGYCPVTNEGDALSAKTNFAKSIENPRLSKLYETIMQMMNDYHFVYHYGIEGYDNTKAAFEKQFLDDANAARAKFLSLPCWN